MRPIPFVLLTIGCVSVAVALVARPFGYEPLPAALGLWLFATLASSAAVLVVTRLFPWRGASDAVMRTTVVCLAIVVASGMALGALGWLFPLAMAGCLSAILAGAAWLTRNRRAASAAISTGVPLPFLAFAAAVVVIVVGYGFIHSPLTAYDSLSYHLFFPARWLQEHRLFIIATPFSDEAQAYAPTNGELYFAWLMLPAHGDLLARVGQVPFFLLIGVAVYALARHAGARPAHAIWPAVFCFVSRPMVEQAVGADVDLICWSLFLTSLYLGLSAAESGHRRDWLLWGISLGLYAGTKYVALVYAPVFLAFPVVWLWRSARAGGGLAAVLRLAWVLPGLAVFALPWYLRNWIVAGSPLYPASLSLAGVTIARGAFSRAAMLHSVFHTTDVHLFPVMLAHAVGTTLAVFWLPWVVLGGWMMARLPRPWPARFFLLVPVSMALLYWFGVPDNVDSRFMLPVAMLGLIPLAFVFRPPSAENARSSWNGAVHALYAAGVLWILIGMNAEIPARLPWFMGGWLSLRGLVSPVHFVLVVVLAGVIGLVAQFTPRALRPIALVVASAVGAAALASGRTTWCAASGCEYLQTTSTFLRPTFLEAWRWADLHVSGATVAYTGNNVPYPLTGPRLTNRVLYVNIDRHAGWRFHDYDRAARQRLNAAPATSLATSSGVLLPFEPAGGRIDAVRPRYERMRGDREAWLANLGAAGVDHLFVSALSAYEIDYVWHNAGGFPIEDDWAREGAPAFTLVYENPQVRIYAVDLRRRAL
jgi:hypothetical protein